MSAVPQVAEKIAFGVKELKAGCLDRVYQKLDEKKAELLVKKRYLVSSEFTLWPSEGAARKGSFFSNFLIPSKFWRSVKIERMEEFALEFQKGDRLISFDLTAGYGHVHLHPLMHDYFLFRYAEATYRFFSLQWVWVPAENHSCKFLRPLVMYIKNVLVYRVL